MADNFTPITPLNGTTAWGEEAININFTNQQTLNQQLIDEINALSGGGGSTTFLELVDTPNSYSGQSGKSAVVNGLESGLEFIDLTTASVSASADKNYVTDAQLINIDTIPNKIDSVVGGVGIGVDVTDPLNPIVNNLNIKQYDTIADAQADTTLEVGDIIEVLGAINKTDEKGHRRTVSATNDGTGVQITGTSLFLNVSETYYFQNDMFNTFGAERFDFYNLLSEINLRSGTVTWVGDSITESDDYDEIIASKFPNATHIDKGIGGNTTLDVIARIEDIKSTNADLFVLAVGVNDARYNDSRGAVTRGEYVANMQTIINELKTVGQVVVLQIWRTYHTDQFADLGIVNTHERVDDWNGGLATLCTASNVTHIRQTEEIDKVVDLNNFNLFTTDGVHPIELGRQLYADAVLYGDVHTEDYTDSNTKSGTKFNYMLKITSAKDLGSFVILKNLIPNPTPVAGKYFSTTANLTYNDLAELFNPSSSPTFIGFANKEGDYPLYITFATNSPLLDLAYDYTDISRAISKYDLFHSNDENAIADPYHHSWNNIKSDYLFSEDNRYLYKKNEGDNYIRCIKSISQDIPINTFTKLTYESEEFEKYLGLNYDSSLSRFNVFEDGVYTFDVKASLVSIDIDDRIIIDIYKNGATYKWILDEYISTSGVVTGSFTIYASQNDYFEVYIYAGSTTPITVENNSTKTYLTITKN